MTGKLLYFIIFLILPVSLSAQSADGRYASRKTMDGTIFFISPQKLNHTGGIKKFQYDMTLLTWSDSATINFTFESDSMEVPDSLKFITSGNEINCNSFSPLFIDIKKGHYEIRITSKISLNDLEKLLSSITPMTFEIKQGNTFGTATYSSGAWKKEKKKLNDIYQLYQYSK